MEQHTGNIFEHTFENVSSWGVAPRMEVLKKKRRRGLGISFCNSRQSFALFLLEAIN